jgi:hypothetical protein
MSKKGKKRLGAIHGFPSEAIDFEHVGFRITVCSTQGTSTLRLSAPDGTVTAFSIDYSDDRLAFVDFLARAAGSVDHFIPAPDEP